MVYHTGHDVSLKTAIKNRKAPEEVMSYQSLKEALDEVTTALETDQKQLIAAQKAMDVPEDAELPLQEPAAFGAASSGPGAAAPDTLDVPDSALLSGLPPDQARCGSAYAAYLGTHTHVYVCARMHLDMPLGHACLCMCILARA